MYRSLRLPETLPHGVRWVISEQLELHLRDVHCMARMPMLSIEGLNSGCNFAMANTLFAVLSGVSATLYEQDGDPGPLFVAMMRDLYWVIDPPAGIEPAEAAKLIYDDFRNPGTHALGLAVRFNGKTKKRAIVPRAKGIKYKKLGSLDERQLELLELSQDRPSPMSATIVVRDDAVVLLVDGLYWGTRCLIEKLCLDDDRMARAERFLNSPKDRA